MWLWPCTLSLRKLLASCCRKLLIRSRCFYHLYSRKQTSYGCDCLEVACADQDTFVNGSPGTQPPLRRKSRKSEESCVWSHSDSFMSITTPLLLDHFLLCPLGFSQEFMECRGCGNGQANGLLLQSDGAGSLKSGGCITAGASSHVARKAMERS